MRGKLIETITLGDYHDTGIKDAVRIDVDLILEGDYVKTFEISEGEPEDMSFGRDLSGAYDVFELVKKAYEYGKQGVEIEFIRKEEEDE